MSEFGTNFDKAQRAYDYRMPATTTNPATMRDASLLPSRLCADVVECWNIRRCPKPSGLTDSHRR